MRCWQLLPFTAIAVPGLATSAYAAPTIAVGNDDLLPNTWTPFLAGLVALLRLDTRGAHCRAWFPRRWALAFLPATVQRN
jgi:hypothetical protein